MGTHAYETKMCVVFFTRIIICCTFSFHLYASPATKKRPGRASNPAGSVLRADTKTHNKQDDEQPKEAPKDSSNGFSRHLPSGARKQENDDEPKPHLAVAFLSLPPFRQSSSRHFACVYARYQHNNYSAIPSPLPQGNF